MNPLEIDTGTTAWLLASAALVLLTFLLGAWALAAGLAALGLMVAGAVGLAGTVGREAPLLARVRAFALGLDKK